MCGLAYCRLRLGGKADPRIRRGPVRSEERNVAGESHERVKVRCQPEIVVFQDSLFSASTPSAPSSPTIAHRSDGE